MAFRSASQEFSPDELDLEILYFIYKICITESYVLNYCHIDNFKHQHG